MAILCTVSGLIVDTNGGPAVGAVVNIARARVAGVRDTAYELRAVTDSTGAFSFVVPQGSSLRLSSTDSADLNNRIVNVPNNVTVNMGTFRADALSEVSARNPSGTPAASSAGISVQEYPNGKIVITLNRFLVTLVKNGTSTGGGGTLMYTFPEGSVLPRGGTSNLTIAAAGDKSFLASVGSAAADTGGTLATTEITFLPSTAATTSSGVGTCKMKSTVSIPVPGTPIDGTATPVPVYLNACLNADATGVEALRFSGTITLVADALGDS